MKILDNEFRKELYKSLVDAGYEKKEAQKIVGVKYFESLKNKVIEHYQNVLHEINGNVFNCLTNETVEGINADLTELQKMYEIINES